MGTQNSVPHPRLKSRITETESNTKAKMNLMPCLATKNQQNHHNHPQYPQLKNPPNQVTTKVPCWATHPAHRLRPKRPLQRPKPHQRPKLRSKNRPPRPKTATIQEAKTILMLK